MVRSFWLKMMANSPLIFINWLVVERTTLNASYSNFIKGRTTLFILVNKRALINLAMVSNKKIGRWFESSFLFFSSFRIIITGASFHGDRKYSSLRHELYIFVKWRIVRFDA